MNTIFFRTETAVFQFDEADFKEPLLEENNWVPIALDLIAGWEIRDAIKL